MAEWLSRRFLWSSMKLLQVGPHRCWSCQSSDFENILNYSSSWPDTFQAFPHVIGFTRLSCALSKTLHVAQEFLLAWLCHSIVNLTVELAMLHHFCEQANWPLFKKCTCHMVFEINFTCDLVEVLRSGRIDIIITTTRPVWGLLRLTPIIYLFIYFVFLLRIPYAKEWK